MGDVIGRLAAILSCNTDGFTGGMKRASDSTKAFEGDMKRFDETVSRGGLSRSFGAQSELAQTFKMLSGGGAIVGLSMATAAFGRMAQSIASAVSAARDGTKTFAELQDEIYGSIPVIGSLYSGVVALGTAMGVLTDASVSSKFNALNDALYREALILRAGNDEAKQRVKIELERADIIDKANKLLKASGFSVADQQSYNYAVNQATLNAATKIQALDRAAAGAWEHERNQWELDTIRSELELFGELQDQLDKLTKSERYLALAKAQRVLGKEGMEAYKAQLDQLEIERAAIRVAEEHAAAEKNLADQKERIADEGRRIAESMRTPMEAYEDQVTRLSMLLEYGSISWETYGRAVRQARSELERSAGGSAQLAPLLERGTQAAYKFDAQAGMKQNANRELEITMKRIEEEARDQSKEAERTNKLLEQLVGKIDVVEPV